MRNKLFFYTMLLFLLMNMVACGNTKYKEMTRKIVEIDDNKVTVVDDNNIKTVIVVKDSIEVVDENGETLILSDDMLNKNVIIFYTGSILETAPMKITGVEKLQIME